MRDSKIRVFPFATVTRLQYGNHVVSSSLSFDCDGETSKRCAITLPKFFCTNLTRPIVSSPEVLYIQVYY